MEEVRVAIVGAGFGGLGAAIRLRAAGIEDVVVLERRDDVGGTWWDNTYPGCACDVPAHLYSFSFAQNPEWSRMFAPQPEILSYLQRVAREHGVLPQIRFGTAMRSARWDEAEQRWQIETAAGSFAARVLVTAAGPLSEPSRPDIAGLDRFEGPIFHSAEWDHDHDLRDRRVAVVGTGASSAQFIPHVQPLASHLTVFQRTPAWVFPRLDFPHPLALRRIFRRFPRLQRGVRAFVYYFAETLVYGLTKNPNALKPNEAIARWNLHRAIKDPELREKLTPDYRIGCKRIIFANDYFPALAQPNVDLVTAGIREVVPDGVVTEDGVHHPADTIILGTGFKVFAPPVIEGIVGRDGRSLGEVWRERGAQAYRGTVVAGFPNHFLIIGPNTGLGNNSMINIIEGQLDLVVDAIATMERERLASIDVRREAQDEHNAMLQRRMEGTVWTAGGCKSWYLGKDGVNRTLWPGYSNEFRRSVARFEPAHFELTALDRRPEPEPAQAA
jgi:cation diffusion facilitator CzcD-associated flavoprotein CzcO